MNHVCVYSYLPINLIFFETIALIFSLGVVTVEDWCNHQMSNLLETEKKPTKLEEYDTVI